MEKKNSANKASHSSENGKDTTLAKSRSNGKPGSEMKSANNSATKAPKMDEMLSKLFIDQLRDIYYAEKLLAKSLNKLAKAATTEELKDALTDHQAETETHVKRLEKVFDILGKQAKAKRCDAMDGLKKEADSIVADTEAGSFTRDVGIIIAAQKVEHYEIASYGCLTQLARTFGMEKIASLLHQTLEEEKAADETLTSIAENNINMEAAQEEEA
ncbi:ferritin-like domain-containing protein [Pseudoflavitalea sp. G-6-1-2]|uniref:YciE/YciF ferroxidase family protein n=1 Tax=Pseudoflavitalea sp. G-6-1-2 TaxID=2728841 RepID=UPI00146CBF2A|nr:ferritin-like domain-containing protein [Pseudoflavitalea sp. G-6-1-2]NML22467.1 ferritin-like domain-containing protein [Pseudoflavitalea sp. G-6-1-2]